MNKKDLKLLKDNNMIEAVEYEIILHQLNMIEDLKQQIKSKEWRYKDDLKLLKTIPVDLNEVV